MNYTERERERDDQRNIVRLSTTDLSKSPSRPKNSIRAIVLTCFLSSVFAFAHPSLAYARFSSPDCRNNQHTDTIYYIRLHSIIFRYKKPHELIKDYRDFSLDPSSFYPHIFIFHFYLAVHTFLRFFSFVCASLAALLLVNSKSWTTGRRHVAISLASLAALVPISLPYNILRMEAWKFVRLEDDDVGVSTAFSFSSCLLVVVVTRSRHSVRLGALARSLSFVYCHWRWQDDGVHVKCSSDSACDRRGFSGAKLRALLRSTFPRHSSTPARLYSTLLSLSFFLFQRSRSTLI